MPLKVKGIFGTMILMDGMVKGSVETEDLAAVGEGISCGCGSEMNVHVFNWIDVRVVDGGMGIDWY